MADKLIPVFSSIKETYGTRRHHLHGITEWALIVPAETGRPPRFHVLRVLAMIGHITLIGNELPLRHARAIARRPSERDGEALTQEEIKEGRRLHASEPNTWEALRWSVWDNRVVRG